MEFVEPQLNGFTIYSKSGCHNCTKIKNLLKEKQLFFIEIDCDDYLIEDKGLFLSFIENKVGRPYSTFPIVFFDGKFVGGYNESVDYIGKILLSFQELF
jgi:glutaredoxin